MNRRVEKLFLTMLKPVVGDRPHTLHQGARAERRSAGNDHDAAQVSGVTIAWDELGETCLMRRTELDARVAN